MGNKELLVDWLEFTCFQDCEELGPEERKKLEEWGFNLEKFEYLESGLMGYKKRMWGEYTQILLAGNTGMKTHIILSAKGVRAYEVNNKAENLINMLTHEDLSFTRIDLALDIKDGSIEFKQLLEYLNKNYIVTRFKKYKYVVEKEISDDGQQTLGETIYFGSRSSNIFVRIYDKAKQMKQNEDSWIRIEIVYKNNHANALALYIAQGEKNLGELFSQTLNNYIRFVEKSNDSNKRRWKTADFWERILEDSKRIKLSFKGEEVDPKKTADWFKTKVAPSLAFLNLYWGGDMQIVENIITGAEEKMPEKYKKILREMGLLEE